MLEGACVTGVHAARPAHVDQRRVVQRETRVDELRGRVAQLHDAARSRHSHTVSNRQATSDRLRLRQGDIYGV